MYPFCRTTIFILFLSITHSGSGNRHEEPAIFDLFSKRKLTLPVTAGTKSSLVTNRMECLDECVGISWCQSGNFKTTSESNGLHVCELLPSDRFTTRNTLTTNQEYDHFNIKVRYIARIGPEQTV